MSKSLSAERIITRCGELARFSEQRDGVTRVYLSPEQRAANGIVITWMREAGMSARLDAIGNVVGRYEASASGLPCLMLGSHLDTVRDAGKYDGVLGVITAIECVRSLHERAKRLPFAIEVIGFADEEGVRFNATLLGSRAIAGTFRPEMLDALDKDGISMREALYHFGLEPSEIGHATRKAHEVLAYAELHIEQGPVLEAEGLPVGLVTAINGVTRFVVTMEGAAGHAGTVPMGHRRDALAAAAECVSMIERRAASVPELVATVGKLECQPGAVNVIPGTVNFSIDVRSPRDQDRLAMVSDVRSALAEICARRNIVLHDTTIHESGVAVCAPWLMKQMEQAISAAGFPVRKLPSGAGHDAMAMTDLTDIVMLFVRCRGGVSHNPAEAVLLDDVEKSAGVFLNFIENFKPNP